LLYCELKSLLIERERFYGPIENKAFPLLFVFELRFDLRSLDMKYGFILLTLELNEESVFLLRTEFLEVLDVFVKKEILFIVFAYYVS
jgi:hypothetical protein